MFVGMTTVVLPTESSIAVLKGMDECDVAVELKAPRRKEQGDEPDTETEDEDEMCEEEEEAELREFHNC
eukprot:1161715-Pelagomonas_calceolata.AAC.7